MGEEQSIDITAMMVLANRFLVRLHQLGFRVIQKVDEQGRDLYQYVIPPLVTIPAGPFLMGSDKEKDREASDDEYPQHEVSLESYEIAKYPLTVAEYACFLQATDHQRPQKADDVTWKKQRERGDHPVVCVSWRDIQAYVQWMAKGTGGEWTMPSEAQWEKAARGVVSYSSSEVAA
jgi:formylglycine-generating enzyme required for sulfatase activity